MTNAQLLSLPLSDLLTPSTVKQMEKIGLDADQIASLISNSISKAVWEATRTGILP